MMISPAAQTTHVAILAHTTTFTWILGLAAQLALAIVVLWRGVWRRLPGFAAQVVVYPLRSAALFLLFGHINHDAYAHTAQTLSLVGLALTALVAGELGVHLTRAIAPRTATTVHRWTPLLTIFIAATALTAVLAATLPVRTLYPLDRVQTFLSAMLVGLGIWALASGVRGLLRIVATGLAVAALADLVTTALRVVAASRRDTATFSTASYADVFAYLAVVIFWLIAFGLRPNLIGSSPGTPLTR